MHLASIDAARVVEGIVGALLLLAVLVVLTSAGLRWQRRRTVVKHQVPGTPALARVGGPVVNPAVFGGGFPAARSVQRRDAVAYGYLAVAEEWVSDDDAVHWCTVVVRLPGTVPDLVVDHRDALNRAGVPGRSIATGETGDIGFDDVYVVGAPDQATIERVLAPATRDALVADPVQRLTLRDSSVLLRGFDHDRLTDERLAGLAAALGRLLASTPSFVTYLRTPIASSSGEVVQTPLPPGFYGVDASPDPV